MAGLLSLFKKKKTPAQCSAVVVAAGSARRMEGIDKVLAPLGELPVLVHTLYAFQDCPAVDEVVVVTREDLLVEVGAAGNSPEEAALAGRLFAERMVEVFLTTEFEGGRHERRVNKMMALEQE